ncbi:MAG TPA: thioredoxin domain-containing protein [Oligoflexus sp.]|uniref:thioredoxin domain-containing protein n=1 Tax=Oligoflexus sp. TaxID=1971216 RepID=UPI002D80CA6F|nr:thioredoxin domain-containing protein [Oligoflexus sp.]HET9241633.1 thioredoxin domain-containing protein [Oligoflexus sp.]
MRPFILFPFILLLAACVSSGQAMSERDNSAQTPRLITLTPEKALKLVNEASPTMLLIEFTTQWCEHCKELKKPLQALAAKGQGRYRIVSVDVTDKLQVMENFGVAQKLPAFRLQVPGSKDPILRYGTGGPFREIVQYLLDEEAPRFLPWADHPLQKPQAYKAMLLAGSSDNANFLQEVSWNYSWLLQKGYKEDEIGCFYAKPDLIQYGGDREQFDQLKPILETCHPVKHQEFLDSIRLSLNEKPSTFYLYVTAHGAAPVPLKNRETFRKSCLAHAPSLALDQTPPDCVSSQGLTVDDLARAMKDGSATKKYLVLQGCYTGGFISPRDNPKTTASPLARLPGIHILTASAARQASFGCNAGAHVTFFGSAYSQAVQDDKQKFETMDWPRIYQDVLKEVTRLEKELQIGKQNASRPQFFKN